MNLVKRSELQQVVRGIEQELAFCSGTKKVGGATLTYRSQQLQEQGMRPSR